MAVETLPKELTKEQLSSFYFCDVLIGSKSPCPVYICFKSRYIQALAEGQFITLEFLAKMKLNQNPLGYVEKSDVGRLNTLLNTRHPNHLQVGIFDTKNFEGPIYAIMDYINEAKKIIRFRNHSSENDDLIKKAENAFVNTCNNPSIAWFFKKNADNHLLLNHSSSVTYAISLFLVSQPLLEPSEQDSLLLASIIHQIDGDPTDTKGKITSLLCLDHIKKQKFTFPELVITTLEQSNELFSGKGFPNKLSGENITITARLFHLFDFYHHIHMKTVGSSRRAKYETIKKTMEKLKEHFDPDLWVFFWKFCDEIEYT